MPELEKLIFIGGKIFRIRDKREVQVVPIESPKCNLQSGMKALDFRNFEIDKPEGADAYTIGATRYGKGFLEKNSSQDFEVQFTPIQYYKILE